MVAALLVAPSPFVASLQRFCTSSTVARSGSTPAAARASAKRWPKTLRRCDGLVGAIGRTL